MVGDELSRESFEKRASFWRRLLLAAAYSLRDDKTE
jgi:hypothetical protein